MKQAIRRNDASRRGARSLLFLFWLLVASALPAAGQTYSVLSDFNYSQGGRPNGGLTLGDGPLYGTASYGGGAQGGCIFAVNPDGSGFSVIKSLSTANGIQPFGNLLLSNGRLYGTATAGGANGLGTVFSVDLAGTNFTVLQNFNGTNGAAPYAGLMAAGGTLYGTTFNGGTNGVGTVFKMNPDGTGFTVLKSFSSMAGDTNCDGARPYGGLACSGKWLYGTTTYGGANGAGTVFKLETNGGGFKVIKTFSAMANYVNGDGAYPYAGVLWDHGMLYGTTYVGGANGNGTVFKLKEDGSEFTVLKTFSSMTEDEVNGDGAFPCSSLVLNGNTLYGTTYEGGTNGYGTVFKLNTIGAGFCALKHFGGDDGANPYAGLVMSGVNLYGTAATGGTAGDGAVFRLALPPFPTNAPPVMTIQAAAGVITLSWNSVAGNNYQVQFTDHLAGFNTWTNFQGVVPGTGSTVSAYDGNGANDTRCYRVVVVP